MDTSDFGLMKVHMFMALCLVVLHGCTSSRHHESMQVIYDRPGELRIGWAQSEKELSSLISSSDGIRQLYIYSSNLSYIPDVVFDLNSLTLLDLDGNVIAEIPDRIYKLQKLDSLSLSSNNIQYGYGNICLLKGLRYLDLSVNSDLDYATLFGDLAFCENLETLRLAGNGIKYLPNSFDHIKGIKSLNLSNNEIRYLHGGFLVMQNLTEFDISGNKVVYLDSLFSYENGNLNIEVLDVGNNLLVDLGRSISTLRRLRVLDVSGNRLTSLPDAMENLQDLEELILHNNPMVYIPDVVWRLKSLKYIHLPSDVNVDDLNRLKKDRPYLIVNL